MWGTCVDLLPAYLHHGRTLAEAESITAVKCRVLLYNRGFEQISGDNTSRNLMSETLSESVVAGNVPDRT